MHEQGERVVNMWVTMAKYVQTRQIIKKQARNATMANQA
jgi:hypothetical protein